MPNIILFDIDYTLIDSAHSKRLCKEKLMKYLNVSENSYDEVVDKYVRNPSGFTDFKPQEFISHIASEFNADKKEVEEIFFDDKNFKEALYKDTEEILKVLSVKNTLGIFSEGYYDFQILKLHKSDILKYFDQNHMYVFRRKLTVENLEKMPKGAMVIDDNIYVVEALEKSGEFKPIWINRRSKEGSDDIKTISNLSQLKDLFGNGK